jgi:putative flippase GtrA
MTRYFVRYIIVGIIFTLITLTLRSNLNQVSHNVAAWKAAVVGEGSK